VRHRTLRASRALRGSYPPERIELAAFELRRMTVGDAAAVSSAATESLEHLRPWMPWATPEGVSFEAQRRRLSGRGATWTATGDYEFGMFLPDGGCVGGCGLHRRIGPGALEIGYWVHAQFTRRGFATASAGALTEAGFGMRRVERMEIHCDEANTASAAVPPKLGYRLADRVDHPPEAPGEVGTRLIWVIYRREWETRAASTAAEPELRTEDT
jgi:ribosomal-protein-serine acetyltransferase